jgi:cell division protein FtsB
MMRRKKVTTREYLIAGGLILLLLWLLFLFWGIFRKEEVARHAAEDSKRQLAALTSREDTLRQNIADLNTERGQEASIRETYGVARAGEEVIIVVPAEEGETVPKESWWDRLFSWLKF